MSSASSGQKGGSIASFFKRMGQTEKQKVSCPVCGLKVNRFSINSHLDGPDCKAVDPDVKDSIKVETDQGSSSQNDVLKVNQNSNCTKVKEEIMETKVKLEDDADDVPENSTHTETEACDKEAKGNGDEGDRKMMTQKRKSIGNSDGKSDVDDRTTKRAKMAKPSKLDDDFSDSEDFMLAVASGEPVKSQDTKASEFNSPVKRSMSKSHVVKLSPSISYNPAKFGGLESLSQSEGADEIVRSGGKTAADKYSSPRYRQRFSGSQEKQTNSPLAKYGIEPKSKRALGFFDLWDQETSSDTDTESFQGGVMASMEDLFTPADDGNRQNFRKPYYLHNFNCIISSVYKDEDDRELFNDDELDVMKKYRSLSLNSQMLYVRLFNRKHTWIPWEKMYYEEIDDLRNAAQSLVTNDLLMDKSAMGDLTECLEILQISDVKTLGKEFNVSPKLTTKAEIIAELVKMATKKNFFMSTISLHKKILARVQSMTGLCYKLEHSSRAAFNRMICLWGIAQWWDQREDDRPAAPLTNLFLANHGRVIYPKYTIFKERKVFRSRDDLIKYESTMKLADKIEAAIAAKNWDTGYETYQIIKGMYETLFEKEADLVEFVKSLPIFLRRLTAPAILTYGLNRGVDLLEKMKKYDEAVEMLRYLLATDLIKKYRGLWWERLSLDLDSHLRKPEAALAAIEEALEDPYVRGARRMSLFHRVLKIGRAKAARGRFDDRLEVIQSRPDWSSPSGDDLPTVVITGKLLSKDGMSGSKSVFKLTTRDESDGSLSTTYCSVEELVREHYRTNKNLPEGFHAEGAVLNSIMGILFWSTIYLSEVDDAFRYPMQTAPLDWDTDCFYENRKESIENMLSQIESMDIDETVSWIKFGWQWHHKYSSSIVSWDTFRGPEQLMGLVSCFAPKQLSQIFRRMVTDHRTYRSGLPDLTLWNPETKEVLFVEVKGPGDKLSYKQIMWIRFFQSIGINAEVCHVDPTGSFDTTGPSFRKLPLGAKKGSKSPLKSSPNKKDSHPVEPKPKKSPAQKKSRAKKAVQNNDSSSADTPAKNGRGTSAVEPEPKKSPTQKRSRAKKVVQDNGSASAEIPAKNGLRTSAMEPEPNKTRAKRVVENNSSEIAAKNGRRTSAVEPKPKKSASKRSRAKKVVQKNDSTSAEIPAQNGRRTIPKLTLERLLEAAANDDNLNFWAEDEVAGGWITHTVGQF